jgi:cysteinyl-tRNA synthetase
VYGGFLQQSGQKMAKSAKNVTRVTELPEQGIDPLAFRLLCFGTRYRSEMDFSWEALEAANARLKNLRQRMADWARASEPASEAAYALDRKFREAVADDLNIPAALVVLSEAERAAIPDGEKFALLASWDHVLGLDLERFVRERPETPAEVQALVNQRDEARRSKDFARSDEIRDKLSAMGWEVMDTPEGTKIRPR